MPISLTWDSREKTLLLRWNRFFSFGWERGKPVRTLLKIPIPFRFGRRRKGKPYLPQVRWIDVKEGFGFLRQWRLERAEGTFSLEDPMIDGVLYGWMTALQSAVESQRIHLCTNFLGENWCSGEATVSTSAAFGYFKRWIAFFFKRGGGRKREVNKDGSNRSDQDFTRRV